MINAHLSEIETLKILDFKGKRLDLLGREYTVNIRQQLFRRNTI